MIQRSTLLCLSIFLLICAPCPAQSDGSRPATSNVRGAEYPRIHADLRVTFRFKAPEAQKVQLAAGRRRQRPRQRPHRHGARRRRHLDRDHSAGGAGIPLLLVPVDGVAVNDPGQRDVFRLRQADERRRGARDRAWTSTTPKDVPHGEVRVRWYHSKITGTWRRALRLHAAGLRHGTRARATRCCTCSTARARTSAAGPPGPRRTSSWTT